MDSLTKSLSRSNWMDDDVYELGLVRHPELGVDRAEVLVALTSMIHGPLVKINPHAFARYSGVIGTIVY